MPRYIDVDEYVKYCNDKWVVLNVDAVNAQPSADVRENVHGEWITPSEKIITEDGHDLMDIFVQCSICGVASLNLRVKRFCPNCGARMEVEE